MSEIFLYDLFLSHSSKDKDVVRPLAERLRADGLKVWFDEWELKPGDNIPHKIEEGLERSRVLVLCMSAHAFGSDWAQLESGTFRFRDPLNKDRRFIPLRLDEAPIKGSLSQFLYINWLSEEREQEYGKLLEACWSEKQKKINEKGNGASFGVNQAVENNSFIRRQPSDTHLQRLPEFIRKRTQGFNQNIPLTREEINKLVNRYIGVEGGYLGDFSYRTHHDFYLNFDLDIDPYNYEGTTRERFIQILLEHSCDLQARILEGILNRF